MLGGLLALVAAATFAVNNAAFRRGALTGTVGQAMAISLALGLALFAAAALATGGLAAIGVFSPASVAMLALAGVMHFAWGRYCNFRATKAMGANLVGPAQQSSIVITLVLAILVLGEALTPLRVLGILLIFLGPAVSLRARRATVVPDRPAGVFRPNYAEGYTFAFLSATGYGASPILVRTSLEDLGLAASIGGGLVAYAAAAAVVFTALAVSGRVREALSVDAVSARWFSISGVLVALSQMFGFMALSVAPVTVVTPIQRLSLVFRVFANSLLNRDHEVLGGRVWLATAISLAGALALSVSTDVVLDVLPLPDWLEATARWQWP